MDTIKIVAQEQRALIVDKAAKQTKKIKTPKNGWIKLVRSALSMSGAGLARRLGVHRTTLYALEKAESDGSITLKKLMAAADSLECDLVYAIVPKKSVNNKNQTVANIIINQAQKKALQITSKVNEHMSLEGQELSENQLAIEINRLTKKIIREMPNDLWEEV